MDHIFSLRLIHRIYLAYEHLEQLVCNQRMYLTNKMFNKMSIVFFVFARLLISVMIVSCSVLVCDIVRCTSCVYYVPNCYQQLIHGCTRFMLHIDGCPNL